MRKKLGAVCMIVGAVLIIGALALLLWNHAEDSRAQQSSAQAVSELKEVIADNIADNENKNEDSSVYENNTENEQMSEVQIDGYDYIGYLTIPSQGLELPVMSDWDYGRLQVAPCRYSGTIAQHNLVVIAHNYSSHFGNLDQLNPHDEVLFIGIDGAVTTYQVSCVDVVPPTATKEVTAGDSDLALVTCTYGGKTRFVVYCDEV